MHGRVLALSSSCLLATLLLAAGCGGPTPDPCAAPGACPSSPSGPAVTATATAPARVTAPRDRTNFDSFGSIVAKRALVPELLHGTSPLVKVGAPLHTEPRLGVPSFLWASRAARDLSHGNDAEQVARSQLAAFAPLYRLQPADLPTAVVRYVHDVGRGPVVVKFRQEVGGIEVFRREINVVLDRQSAPLAISGYLTPEPAAHVKGGFSIDAAAAVAYAAEDLGGDFVEPHWLAPAKVQRGRYLAFGHAPGKPAFGRHVLTRPARVKRVLYDRVAELEPAYFVELHLGERGRTTSDVFAYVVSAVDGAVLSRQDLTQHEAFSYRVWADATGEYRPWDGPQGTDMTPHPTGLVDGSQPADFAAPNDVMLQNAPFSRNDPWLAADATETVGNNVDAYVDLYGDDGYSPADGDFRAPLSTAGTREFLWDAVPYGDPRTPDARNAGIVQLFYTNNWLHDWYYDAGFDEAAGNAQLSNFGRGGEEGDPVLAEAQDSSGMNNANMATPPDGSSPRMQMYLWDVSITGVGPVFLWVNSPATMSGLQHAGTVTFGPQAFDVPAEVAYDTTNPDGCGNFHHPTVTGKIALVDFNFCNANYDFAPQAQNAAAAGAVGLLLSLPPGYPAQYYSLPGAADGSEVPTLVLSDWVAGPLKAALTAPTPEVVDVEMYRALAHDRDGAFDAQVVSHEWAHYLSNRLVGDGLGINTNMAAGLGEGWSDFNALLVTVRPEDAQVASNAGWRGVYSVAGYDLGGPAWDGLGGNQAYYFGIRRVPYSTDFTKNGLTFKHITNGEVLPAGNPVNWLFYWPANNSEVHNAGEIWATMLWECYAALLNDPRHSFAEAQRLMRDYVVAGMKATPLAPTFLEARDAILAAARANDETDFETLGAAFARRGAGVGAISPDRMSQDNVGVVESFYWGTGAEIVSVTVDDSVTWCDKDGVLDNGERGVLTVTIRNTGNEVLEGATATVTADNQNVTFPAGTELRFAPIAIGETGTATVDVALDGASTNTVTSFGVTLTAGSGAPVTTSTAVWVNADEVPESGAGDQFETKLSVWTIDHDPAFPSLYPWRRDGGAGNGHMHGPDPQTTEDHYLISPPVQVSLTDDLWISFRHRYDFEYGFDGGIVELRVWTGTDWSPWFDIGLGDTPLYQYPGNPNPLADGVTNTLSGRNPSWPDYDFIGGTFEAMLAGATVQFRWRYAADPGWGYYGWDVDDVTFGGIVNTPFPTLVADRGLCVNRRPIAVATAASPVSELTVATLVGSGSSDPDGDALTYAWTQVSGPAVVLSDATAADPTFTAPEVTAAGAVLGFQLVVTDTSANTSLPAKVMVQVANVNRAPVANAGAAQTVDEGAVVVLDGTGSSDPDGDPLTFAWSQTGTPAVTLSDAKAARPVFQAPAVAADTVLNFSLTVSDGSLSSTPATVAITVKHRNLPPIADAGASQTVAEGDTVTLDGTGSSDPENATVTYAWRQIGGPAVTLDDATADQPTFTAPGVALDTVLSFELTVSDGALVSAPALVDVVVQNVNVAPTAVIAAPITVVEGTLVTLDGRGSTDPDGTPLTFVWTQTAGPDVTISDSTAGAPTFVAPAVADDTEVTFSLVVSDGALTSAAATATITVTHVNRGPVADAGIAQTAQAGDAVTLHGGASTDPEGGTLRYSWQQIGGATVELSNVTAASASFTVPPDLKQPEILSFMLLVTDEQGLTATAITTVGVLETGSSGCGCRAAGDGGASVPLVLLLVAGMIVIRRRRR